MSRADKPPVVLRCSKKDPNRDFECVYSDGHPGRCCMQRRADIVAGEYVGWMHAWKNFAKWEPADKASTDPGSATAPE